MNLENRDELAPGKAASPEAAPEAAKNSPRDVDEPLYDRSGCPSSYLKQEFFRQRYGNSPSASLRNFAV
jgi:hypothetical protein